MVRFTRVFSLALLLGVSAWSVQGQVNNPKNMDPSPSPQGGPDAYHVPAYWPSSSFSWDGFMPSHPQLYRLWKSLEGRYESSAEGTRFVLDLHRISPYVLFVESTTEAGGVKSVERGYLWLGDASVSYTSTKIRFALFYRREALRSDYGCSLYGRPSPDGITFASEDTDCSFALGRKVSKLTLHAASDELDISEGNGDVTVLRRVKAQ